MKATITEIKRREVPQVDALDERSSYSLPSLVKKVLCVEVLVDDGASFEVGAVINVSISPIEDEPIALAAESAAPVEP